MALDKLDNAYKAPWILPCSEEFTLLAFMALIVGKLILARLPMAAAAMIHSLVDDNAYIAFLIAPETNEITTTIRSPRQSVRAFKQKP